MVCYEKKVREPHIQAAIVMHLLMKNRTQRSCYGSTQQEAARIFWDSADG